MGAALMAVVAAIAIVVILLLAPGMLVNLLLDRFADSPDGFIGASVKDEATWIVSMVFWTGLVVWGRRRYKRYIAHTDVS